MTIRTQTRRMLAAEEEAALARAYLAGDRKAGERIVLAHEPLADAMAYKLLSSGRDIDDLRQEARIGLIKALEGFDPGVGVRFNTYARWWIRASLNEHMIKSQSMVGMYGSSAMRRLFFKLRSTKARLGILHEGDLHPEEAKLIAEDLGVEADTVMLANRQLMSNYVTSLDVKLGENADGPSRLDMLVDPDSDVDDLHERMDAERTTAQVREILNSFKPREREIIEKRTIGGATLQDLADKYGITRERIRQLEVRAIKTIKSALVGTYGYAA